MVWRQGLDVSFVNVELAAIYNSKAELERRWGTFGVLDVGRRLLELTAAGDLGEVATLPGACVQEGEDGYIEIVFRPEELIVTCRLEADHPNCLRVSAISLAQDGTK